MINWMEEAKKRQDEMVKDLSDWVKINSVYDESTITEEMPFGKGVEDAFQFILKKAKEDDFDTLYDDGYACHIDYGQGSEIMGILGHVDVVPEGEGWQQLPFSGAIEDGFIYGRGTQDDKGPVMAAYYAMKIIKELNVPISKKIRMILGGNEERDWKCVTHYFNSQPAPDFGFTPDGDFPLVFGEKNIRMFKLSGQFTCEQIEYLKGGTAANSVPDHAEVKLNFMDSALEEKFKVFLEKKRLEGTYSVAEGKTHIEITGISTHGSTPERGVNAVVFLLAFLDSVIDDPMIHHFSTCFQDYNGVGMGIDFVGDKMGALTMNLGIADYKEGTYAFTLDTRYPMEMDERVVFKGMEKAGTGLPWGGQVEELGYKKGLYLDLESDLIKTLHKAYIDHTGDTETKPFVIGGGSYARATENIVCFGMLFPESKNLMHQKNEAVNIEELVKATAIYAQAIYDLTKA